MITEETIRKERRDGAFEELAVKLEDLEEIDDLESQLRKAAI